MKNHTLRIAIIKEIWMKITMGLIIIIILLRIAIVFIMKIIFWIIILLESVQIAINQIIRSIKVKLQTIIMKEMHKLEDLVDQKKIRKEIIWLSHKACKWHCLNLQKKNKKLWKNKLVVNIIFLKKQKLHNTPLVLSIPSILCNKKDYWLIYKNARKILHRLSSFKNVHMILAIIIWAMRLKHIKFLAQNVINLLRLKGGICHKTVMLKAKIIKHKK